MKRISSILIIIVISFFLCFDGVSATISAMPKPTQIETVRSSDDTEEYFEVETPLNEDNIIRVSGKTKVKTYLFCFRLFHHEKINGSRDYVMTAFVAPNEEGEFSIEINTAKDNTVVPVAPEGMGTVIEAEQSYSTQPGHHPVEQMRKGIYHFTIARAVTEEQADVSPTGRWWEGNLGNWNGVYGHKTFLMQVTGDNNNPKLIEYKDVVNNNERYQKMYESTSGMAPGYKGSYVRYLDRYMSDVYWMFENPKTKVVTPINSKRAQDIKILSDKIVNGANTNYDKMKKIYEYVTGHFYYDKLGYENKKYQYDNPYLNLMHYENKTASENSTNEGQVATTCQGFSSMVAALGRAQNIPVRLIRGYHISSIDVLYSDKKLSDINKMNHWWAEAYVNGKWMIIDATAGTNARWERTSFSDPGTWHTPGTATYSAFNPTMKVFANHYLYHQIYKGSLQNAYVNYANEYNQLKAFLNISSSGKTNCKRLNSSYNQNKPGTWSNSNKLKTDGYGRVDYIDWSYKSLKGPLNLSNFKAMRFANVGSNNITSINVNNCTSLTQLHAFVTKVTTFDGRTAKNLRTINFNGSKLKKAMFKDGAKTITIKTNKTKGRFAFRYEKGNKKRLTIQLKTTPKGYRYAGIYRGKKRLSTKKAYTFNPTKTSTYTVKFKRK